MLLRSPLLPLTQVLQTEAGKPMTFVLAAENAKMVHWPSRLGAGLAALTAIVPLPWMVMATAVVPS